MGTSNDNGNNGDLWLEGTFAYGAIVIFVNMTILYGSFSHSFFSLFFIFGSVASFFAIFFLFSFLGLSTLDHLFPEIFSFPITGVLLLFFFIFNFPVDTFLNFINLWQREREDYADKQRKLKERKSKERKSLDADKILAPIHRCNTISLFNSLFRHWLRFQW
jgi:hypothetical protein